MQPKRSAEEALAESAPATPGTNPGTPSLKKLSIPKLTKLRAFEGCSNLKDYEMQEKIGEGTFGIVHRACHRKTKQVVALKRILMHNEKDGFPITALREIRILKMLNHPNVVPLTDMTVERGDKSKKKRGAIYMVTPYMDHDLSGLLENPKVQFTPAQIKCYMQQLLEGTGYLHSMHILHRDMKAANLLINNQGILQIADFGLARLYEDEPAPDSDMPKRQYTNCVVTRWYRPPELLLGERCYTPAIDLWGVGCVMGEIYLGKPMFQGRTDVDQLDLIFRLCGGPTESSMPGWTNLPGCEGVKSFAVPPRILEKEYAVHGIEMANLLGSLLTLNPSKRPTATQALQAKYFSCEPLPAEAVDLPTYESSHELDKSGYAAAAAAAKAPAAAGEMAKGGNGNLAINKDAGVPSTSWADNGRPQGNGAPERGPQRVQGHQRDVPARRQVSQGHGSTERDRWPERGQANSGDRDRWTKGDRDRRGPRDRYDNGRNGRDHDRFRDQNRGMDRGRSHDRDRYDRSRERLPEGDHDRPDAGPRDPRDTREPRREYRNLLLARSGQRDV
ncbi:kinase-like domain-containing protein [Protomyces lactucae-debilis]|uniref:Kinase-like domain-containing protein n=1 Tax=Protomyces lactucae-debilis TaxID=2754530 RepID=A0A1Y2FCE6_PROLT|nr:kinase-like domain-containing protein [Protomyces lactucae-debilis]ORY81598.1 kinase-like domain-containing protein [Protomyces lactucae-debilis]